MGKKGLKDKKGLMGKANKKGKVVKKVKGTAGGAANAEPSESAASSLGQAGQPKKRAPRGSGTQKKTFAKRVPPKNEQGAMKFEIIRDSFNQHCAQHLEKAYQWED